MEKEDLPIVTEWLNNPEFSGEHNPLIQMSRAQEEKWFDDLTPEKNLFIVEKKEGSKIGFVRYSTTPTKVLEIGFAVIPSERCKGYCTEATKIILDYLFLSKDIIRIQAHTDPRNVASQRVLEKVGFKKEGLLRMFFFIRGEWRNIVLYSILREEWKEPRILTKTVSQR